MYYRGTFEWHVVKQESHILVNVITQNVHAIRDLFDFSYPLPWPVQKLLKKYKVDTSRNQVDLVF